MEKVEYVLNDFEKGILCGACDDLVTGEEVYLDCDFDLSNLKVRRAVMRYFVYKLTDSLRIMEIGGFL